MARRPPRTLAMVVLAVVAFTVSACPRQHVSVASVPDLGYPTCEGHALPEGELLAHTELRSGPTMIEQDIVERFEVRKRDCVYTVRVRQAWRGGTVDLDLVYDRNWLPLRVWRRTVPAGVTDERRYEEITRYELRTPVITIRRRKPGGQILSEQLLGGRPRAILTAGRGSVTAWISQAHLAQGESLREPVLDLRDQVERVRDITLRRDEDFHDRVTGKTLRSYAIYGRETVFADEHDFVVGDLMGLRRSEWLTDARHTPFEMPAIADPATTP